jgi:hypothetical protein
MALRGREMDVQWVYETITQDGFDDEDGTRVLVDDGHATGQPTRKNILRAIAWLVKGAEAGRGRVALYIVTCCFHLLTHHV